ncbi:unnamed protein product [Prorocentrum cordatum]|uniref:Uncharacterized protein n=1 Tax=Prorocentrum cordatum TaxID=2364126 RepID=A0ABN9TNU5_9DINO|nr:unnamed protein product [Polarella glacialis]
MERGGIARGISAPPPALIIPRRVPTRKVQGLPAAGISGRGARETKRSRRRTKREEEEERMGEDGGEMKPAEYSLKLRFQDKHAVQADRDWQRRLGLWGGPDRLVHRWQQERHQAAE